MNNSVVLFLLLIACLLSHATGVRPDGPPAWRIRTLAQIESEAGINGTQKAPPSAVTAAAPAVRKPASFIRRMSRPFLRVHDTETATGWEMQRLYDQAFSVSSIAYLLFGAAEPMTTANGLSRALLPYLTPLVFRAYSLQPERCSSNLVELLYGLSRNLYGTAKLQAPCCHYSLSKALNAIFTWLRDNFPLRLQEVSGHPDATVAWPDLSAACADDQLLKAVQGALMQAAESNEESGLKAAAVTLTGCCSLGIPQFSAVVPNISRALQQLHADLGELQRLATERLHGPTRSSWRGSAPISASPRLSSQSLPLGRGPVSMWSPSPPPPPRRALLGGADVRRGLQASVVAADYSYSMPPADFVVQPPASMPKLRIGLVLHVMLYKDSGAGDSIGPPGYKLAPSYVQLMVKMVNYMSSPTNIEFFVREVRNDATNYPYLLLQDRKTWLQIGNVDCVAFRADCFLSTDFVTRTASDFPRSINVYVANDMTGRKGVMGYAFVPGSDTLPTQGFVFLCWDQLLADGGANSNVLYNDGPNTLLHELFHHLGLMHPFDKPLQGPVNVACMDGDLVVDTPTSKGPIRDSSFFAQALGYCLELFWGRYGGDWEATYKRWSTTLGIPDLDKNSWADSCPKSPGFDELGNYMTYSSPVCFAALGHFTVQQALRAHEVASELNPIMYGWGQYAAAKQAAEAAPPPQLEWTRPPSPESSDGASCRTTAVNACVCKPTWQYKGKSYSYCNRTDSTDVVLRCEVAVPSSCRDCGQFLIQGQQCILPCSGDPRVCKSSPPPAAALPPPPVPKTPSPRPLRLPSWPPPRQPPLSADALPRECTVSVRNCTCRSNWIYNGKLGAFCSLYYTGTLMCLVTPDCPSFHDIPFQACNTSLTVTDCSPKAPPPPATGNGVNGQQPAPRAPKTLPPFKSPPRPMPPPKLPPTLKPPPLPRPPPKKKLPAVSQL